jgi:XTP/dITP diphosphohydrolase
MQLVIASRNVHKIRELRAMLKGKTQFDIFSCLDFPTYVPPFETEKTFEGNASLKAMHAARTLNCWVLADDSGLVIPALNGAPGVYSARYAGPQATDAENRQKLLREMQSLNDVQRQGYLECVLALASPEGLKKCVRGVCEGMITAQEQGGRGFGYDPLFMKHEYGKTFAELNEEVKNRISHRRKAFDRLLITLQQVEASLMKQ